MKDRCIQAVSQAIGRSITQEEAKDIEQRIVKQMRRAAMQDPQGFKAMDPEERLTAAANLAGQDLIAEASLKKTRIALTIKAHDRIANFMAEAKAKGMDGLEALKRTLVFNADGKSNTMSAESRGNAIKANAVRQLIDTFEAVDPKFWGLFESNEGIRILTKAIFGEKTDVPQANKGAKAWHDVADQLKKQFNDAGGKIGNLEDWALPQHHSQPKIVKAGVDRWVTEILPMLKRERYVKEDGTLMNDAELQTAMRSAWLTLATGGINKLEPGQASRTGMAANRNAEARSIHFKDADSYLKYQENYGEKSLWGVITGHVEGLSKEIAMLDTYGPNPDLTFKFFMDKEMQAAALLNPGKTEAYKVQVKKLQNLYDYVTGHTAPVVNQHLAQAFDTLRNWLVASRLGSAVITALSDEATIHLTAKLNNLPEMQLIQNEVSALNIANRTEENLAHRAGLALDTLTGHLNRWGSENLGPTWSSKMANTVMRASGLEALDGARRRAFGVTMMSALGEMTGKYETLADLDPMDNRILLSKGITETDWTVWRQAELEKWGAGNGVLTPEAIMRIDEATINEIAGTERAKIETEKAKKLDAIEKMAVLSGEQRDASYKQWSDIYDKKLASLNESVRRDAVLRLLGVTLEETDMAVLRPGAEDRAFTGSGMERGTWKGELTRSFFQFKAFPLAMIRRHWMQRAGGMPTTGGKAAYLASLIVATTVLGAVSQTVNDLLQGKNPRDYKLGDEFAGRNWMAAFLKGGSLGLYGDFLFSGATQHSQNGPVASLMGPVAGLVEEAFGLTQGNAIQFMQGKDTHFGAELTRFVRSNTPGANLWYAKAALDHLVFHQMQEYFSPGYLAKMQRRAKDEFGQTYFWKPGAGVDQMNAPDLSKAIGE